MPYKAKISDIMSTNLFTVGLEDTVHHADEMMKNEKIRHIPVLENRKIIGMLSERKIMEYSLRQIYDPEQTYGDDGFNRIIDYEKIMEPVNHVIYPEDSVAKAVKLMSKHKLDALPVVDWELNIVGIVTQTDIMLYIHKMIEEEKL